MIELAKNGFCSLLSCFAAAKVRISEDNTKRKDKIFLILLLSAPVARQSQGTNKRRQYKEKRWDFYLFLVERKKYFIIIGKIKSQHEGILRKLLYLCTRKNKQAKV